MTVADDATWADAGQEFVDVANDVFADSLLLVGRVLGGHPDAVAAAARRADGHGVDLELTLPDGATSAVRVAYATPIDDPDDLNAAGLALVARAREERGDDTLTSAEARYAEVSALRTYVTSVAAVEEVHPHLRRITFRGGDLDTFAPLGPDTFCYVLLPPAGRAELTIDQSFSWEAYETMAPEERPVGAYYTLVAWRPEVAELDMLFVLHGDDGAGSAWAARAQPGDPVALWGPRESWAPPAGTDWYLLVADDTGLPAVAGILDALDPAARVLVFAEVDNADERQALPEHPGADVTWLFRNGAPPGTTTALVDEVRAATFPPGTPYVWGGAESRVLTAIRKYVRRDLGFARESVMLVGYWRHPASPAESTDDD